MLEKITKMKRRYESSNSSLKKKEKKQMKPPKNTELNKKKPRLQKLKD